MMAIVAAGVELLTDGLRLDVGAHLASARRHVGHGAALEAVDGDTGGQRRAAADGRPRTGGGGRRWRRPCAAVIAGRRGGALFLLRGFHLFFASLLFLPARSNSFFFSPSHSLSLSPSLDDDDDDDEAARVCVRVSSYPTKHPFAHSYGTSTTRSKTRKRRGNFGCWQPTPSLFEFSLARSLSLALYPSFSLPPSLSLAAFRHHRTVQ